MRSSVHPPATLECEQRRRPVMLLWLEGFSTILAALAMLLLRPASRCQVLLPLTARPACTQPSLTAGCAPCAVGACQPLPFNHHTTRAMWLGSATTCSRAAACLVHHVHRGRAPCACSADSAVPEVRRVLNLDPMLCGVVVELDRLSTGLGKPWGA